MKYFKIFIIFFLLFNFNNLFFCMSENKIKTSIDEIIPPKEQLFLQTEKPNIQVDKAIIVNKNTGQIIYSINADETAPIYSCTKILSSYVIFDMLKQNGNIYNLDTKIKCSEKISIFSNDQKFSNIHMKANAEYSIGELLDAAMIASSNAAMMLIGDFLFGNQENFVEKIKNKVKQLNLKKTFIVSSTGIDSEDLKSSDYKTSDNGFNKMTCTELCYASCKLLQDHPEILKITSKNKCIFGKNTGQISEEESTNTLLEGMPNQYLGVNGIKTGSCDDDYSGNFCFSYSKDNQEFIGVILGAKNIGIRTKTIINLLDYATKKVKEKVLLDTNYKLFDTGEINLKYSLKNKIKVKLKDNLKISYTNENFKTNLFFIPNKEKYDTKSNNFIGSIKKGEVIGKVVPQFNDLFFLTNYDNDYYGVDVISQEDAKDTIFPLNIIEDFFKIIEDMFHVKQNYFIIK